MLLSFLSSPAINCWPPVILGWLQRGKEPTDLPSCRIISELSDIPQHSMSTVWAQSRTRRSDTASSQFHKGQHPSHTHLEIHFYTSATLVSEFRYVLVIFKQNGSSKDSLGHFRKAFCPSVKWFLPWTLLRFS